MRNQVRITEAALLEAWGDGWRSLDDVGKEFGVTRERIRQLRKKYGIPSFRVLKEKRYCLTCDRLLFANNHGIYCRAHRPLAGQYVECGSCGKQFFLANYNITARTRPVHRLRTGPRTTPFFCSRSCYGKWWGTHYGYGMRPQNRHTAKALEA